MTFPANWQNPIAALPGQFQTNVDPAALLPSRHDLSRVRLDIQKALLDSGTQRHTPILVTSDGVIWDGHHAVRVACEEGKKVAVRVVRQKANPSAASIMDLSVG